MPVERLDPEAVFHAARQLPPAERTAYRHWTYARAWLRDALDDPG